MGSRGGCGRRRAPALFALAVMTATLGVLLPAAAPAEASYFVSNTQLVSVRDGGAASSDPVSGEVARAVRLSGDGRYVAFQSPSGDIVPGDTNGLMDVFVYEPATRRTVQVSIAFDGSRPGDGNLHDISADGRYVMFTSNANYIAGQVSNGPVVFVRDRDADGDGVYDEPGESRTVVVSKPAVPGQVSSAPNANNANFTAAMSGDGRFVAFASSATNLEAGATNGTHQDVFVADRDSDADGVFDEPGATSTRRVSV